MFQFHNGSIKSDPPPTLKIPTNEFQFHNGSIKSTIRTLMTVLLEGFNSTMVRLKGYDVRVRAVNFIGFQFHNGSIKS